VSTKRVEVTEITVCVRDAEYKGARRGG